MPADCPAAVAVRAFAAEPEDAGLFEAAVRCGLDALPWLAEALRVDQAIERVEQIERVVKSILRNAMIRELSGRDARRIAAFQQALGFLLKYKSYSIKAATPLGYSLFLQNQGEGFSFQRHLTHKTEVFHILEVKPGGYVFLCNHADWSAVYEPRAFNHWLAGAPDERYDRFRFVPQPGDVFVVSELGIVHSVIGCVLEEFATVSTDMVDRLHDQNARRPVPEHFARGFAERALLRATLPASNRLVDLLAANRTGTPLTPRPITGGTETTLIDSFVRASRWSLDGGAETAPVRDARRAIVLRVGAGRGRLFVGEPHEWADRDRLSLGFAAGDLFMVPPGAVSSIRCDAGTPVQISEHRITPEAAFV